MRDNYYAIILDEMPSKERMEQEKEYIKEWFYTTIANKVIHKEDNGIIILPVPREFEEMLLSIPYYNKLKDTK